MLNKSKQSAFKYIYELFLGSCLLFSLVLLGSPSASAHAQLVATYPVDNSEVTSAPEVIVLSWGEDVRTNARQFSITRSDGSSQKFSFNYRFDATTSEGSASLVPVAKLPTGSYIVSWKVVSHDGHLVAGATTFGINVSAATVKSSSSTSLFDEFLQGFFWLLMIFTFGAIMSGRRRIYSLTARLILLVGLARLMSTYLVLHGSFLTTGSAKISICTFIFLPIIIAIPKTKLNVQGDTKLYQLILLSILFVSQPFFEGHPLDVIQPGYLKYLSAGHLLFALLWTGSVIALALKRDAAQYAITRRISTTSIFLLVLFGGALTYFLALPLNFASKSAWDTFIVVKIALVLTALFIGAYHHFAGKKALESSEFPISKTLLLESVTIISIVTTTALLVGYTPPKIIANQYKISQRLTSANSGNGYLNFPVKFDNGLTGTFYVQKVTTGKPAMIMLAVKSKKSLKSPIVDVYFSNTKLNIIDLHSKLAGASNQYMSYLSIPGKGSWHLSIQILIDEFTQTQANFNVNI